MSYYYEHKLHKEMQDTPAYRNTSQNYWIERLLVSLIVVIAVFVIPSILIVQSQNNAATTVANIETGQSFASTNTGEVSLTSDGRVITNRSGQVAGATTSTAAAIDPTVWISGFLYNPTQMRNAGVFLILTAGVIGIGVLIARSRSRSY